METKTIDHVYLHMNSGLRRYPQPPLYSNFPYVPPPFTYSTGMYIIRFAPPPPPHPVPGAGVAKIWIIGWLGGK